MMIFAEINKTDFSHLSINIAMLEILKNQDKHAQINIYAERNHIRNISKVIPVNNDVLTSTINVVDGSYLLWPYKLILDFLNLVKIFSFARKNNVNVIFISSIFPLSHLFYLMIRPFYKKTKVVLCLHGELQYLLPRSWKDRILGFFLNLNLKNASDKNTVFVVFSEMIKNNLFKVIPNVLDRIIAIDHPYSYSYRDNNLKRKGTICFGSIGVASLSKRSHLIFALAHTLKQYVEVGTIKFKIIGRSDSDFSEYYNDQVTCILSKNMLPILEYKKEIDSLDFLIFFYADDLYSLSPSGVFFEALECVKPVIAINNDFFNHYFTRFGNIGYLCENIDDMARLIEALSQDFNIEEYNLQVENIQKAKRSMNLKSISKKFWNSYDLMALDAI